jgi:16S rRNA (guanine1516-N2)-methyltransferase
VSARATAPPVSEPIVVAGDDTARSAAEALAVRLGARLWSVERWASADGPPVVVWVDAEGVGLRGPPRQSRPRRPAAPPEGGRPGREHLLRATLAGTPGLRLVDATAGWGGDAGVLAAAGAEVLMIERSPFVAAMLDDALRRWRAEGVGAAGRLTVLVGEAEELLTAVGPVDVVYLDPLYAERGGSAVTSVGLRWLRVVANWGTAREVAAGVERRHADEASLLTAARQAARRRVVVKRGLRDAPLGGQPPSGSLRGRTTRFDMYPPLAPAA